MITFDENTTSLLEGQKRSFELCCTLLREDDDLSRGGKSRRSIRQRARKFLKDIYQSIGPEVFLLCTLGPSITRLGENALRIRLSTIQTWWCTALKPQGLTTVATELCQAKTISSLVQSKDHDTNGNNDVLQCRLSKTYCPQVYREGDHLSTQLYQLQSGTWKLNPTGKHGMFRVH